MVHCSAVQFWCAHKWLSSNLFSVFMVCTFVFTWIIYHNCITFLSGSYTIKLTRTRMERFQRKNWRHGYDTCRCVTSIRTLTVSGVITFQKVTVIRCWSGKRTWRGRTDITSMKVLLYVLILEYGGICSMFCICRTALTLIIVIIEHQLSQHNIDVLLMTPRWGGGDAGEGKLHNTSQLSTCYIQRGRSVTCSVTFIYLFN